MLAAQIQPDAGEMRVYGYDVLRHPKQIQGLTNLVSVEASFYKQLSVMENLLNGARLYGLKCEQANLRVEEILGRLGFSKEERQAAMEELPREKMRMVSIAQALVSQPRLLLMDDKFCGLAADNRQEIFLLIQEMRQRYGVTSILTSSKLDELDGVCDQLVSLDKGKIVDPGRLTKNIESSFQISDQPVFEQAALD